MLGKFFKVSTAIILSFVSIALISQVLLFFGPILGGVIVTSFDLANDPQLAKTMESAGNILVLIASIYVGVKVYKKIIGGKTSDLSPEKTSEQ